MRSDFMNINGYDSQVQADEHSSEYPANEKHPDVGKLNDHIYTQSRNINEY